MSDTPNAEYVPSPEPIVTTPLLYHGGVPACPFCGYRCGCCCFHGCQTPCPTPDEDGNCSCDLSCHGGHEPWDCGDFSIRYDWARRKAEAALIAGAAMSDTPDVHDAQWLPADLLWIAPHLHRLSALGYVVVKADGLQHGDELVRLGTTWSSLTGDPPPPPTYVLRRPVPENGERPHTHTRGIDRGDCPECDAEYGDTDG